MTTAIDTNIIVCLWSEDAGLSGIAEKALESAHQRGRLVISAPVFAELIAAPGRVEGLVDQFLKDNHIGVDWDLGEAVWRMAARAFQTYSERRRQQGGEGARRILADFLIGAHAAVHNYRLLTLDERIYRAAFPTLRLETA